MWGIGYRLTWLVCPCTAGILGRGTTYLQASSDFKSSTLVGGFGWCDSPRSRDLFPRGGLPAGQLGLQILDFGGWFWLMRVSKVEGFVPERRFARIAILDCKSSTLVGGLGWCDSPRSRDFSRDINCPHGISDYKSSTLVGSLNRCNSPRSRDFFPRYYLPALPSRITNPRP